MLKNLLGKTSVYFAAFAFGYIAGHFNHVKRVTLNTEPLTHTRLVSACPTITSHTSDKAAPPTQELRSHKTPTANEEEELHLKAEVMVALTDFDNPDEQIQAVLTADLNAFSQAGEQPAKNEDPLETMYELPPEHQLGYVKNLVNSNEDAAILALNELILHDNSAIQNAAIEGMLDLLEMRTGHYETIAQNLEQNSVFLSEEQLDKLHGITQLAAANP